MASDHHILVVDDHPLFRDALRLAIGPRLDATIDEADSLAAARTRLTGETDLVLLDLNLPDVQGLSGLASLRAEQPDVAVAIISASEEPALVRRCLRMGATGYITKSRPAAEIGDAIQAILDGHVWTPPDISLEGGEDSEEEDVLARLATLTPQQVRVLTMLGEGLLNKQIAFSLGVSEATVKAHVSAILQKLGVDSRTQAVIAASKVDAVEWRQPAA